MKCAVFGANGYIGKHISFCLKISGYEVYNYDIQVSSDLDNYSQLDICDSKQFYQLPSSIDKIYFFAGLTGTADGFTNAQKYTKVNELGLLNLLQFLVQTDSNTHIVYPSTRLVYKGSKRKLSESGKKDPKTIYAVNKLSAESLLRVYSDYYGLHYTVFRICVPYGNMFSNDYSYGTIGFFLKQIDEKGVISLYGDGELRRTFTYIEDICEQIITCSLNKMSINNIYNIAGEDFSLKEVANKMTLKFGGEVRFVEWNRRDLIIETGSTVFDFKKINSIISRPIKTSLNEWIEKL